MRIIEIIAAENGGHGNQQADHITVPPAGWAVVPDTLPTSNFPFGEITVEEINGVPTVTSWTPLPIPPSSPEPEPPQPMTADTLAAAYLSGVQEA